MGVFLNDITKFVNSTIQKQNDIVRDIVTEVIESPIGMSPVVTGNFVTNWLLGIDSNIPWGVTGYKNSDPDSARNQTADRLIAKIPVEASGHLYTLVNNTNYAAKLEDKYSMIAITELHLDSMVRRVVARYS